MTNMIIKRMAMGVNGPECPCVKCKLHAKDCEWCDTFMDWFDERKELAHLNQEFNAETIEELFTE